MVSDFFKDCHYKNELIVRQQPAIANYNAPVVQEVSVCVCCVSKGRCKLECNFQSDTYVPGEEAFVVCKVNNTACTVAIQNIEIRLLQHITFKTKAGKETAFTRDIVSNHFPGIAAGASNEMAPQILSLKLTDPNSVIMTKGKEAMLQPNVAGTLIQCRYDMEVYPIFDAACSCCSNVPRTSLPLFIYAPQLSGFIGVLPPNFQPIKQEVQQIIIPLPDLSMNVNLAVPNVQVNVPNVQVSVPNVQVSMPDMQVKTTNTQENVSIKMEPNVTMQVNSGVITNAEVKFEGSGPQMTVNMPAPTLEINANSQVLPQGQVTVSTGPSTEMHVSAEGNTSDMNAQVKMPEANVKFQF